MDDAAYLRRLPVISVLTLESTLDIILRHGCSRRQEHQYRSEVILRDWHDATADSAVPARTSDEIGGACQSRLEAIWREAFVTTPWGFIGKRETQIILKMDERSIVFELGRDGKFVVKSGGWDSFEVGFARDDLSGKIARPAGPEARK